MATAVVIEETIPCEHCESQISFQDWPSHVRQCVPKKKSSPKNIKKYDYNDVEQTTTDSIPCEFCHAQICVTDWESHSKQCVDSHKRRTENLKKGMDDESTIEHIPCEYCNQLIDLHELEWHSRLCVNNNNHVIGNTDNIESMGTVIPCEYCGRQIDIPDWTVHTEQCAKAEKKRIEDIIKRSENDPNHNLIPCEYCNKSFAIQLFEDHQTECRRQLNAAQYQSNGPTGLIFGGTSHFPDTWDLSAVENLTTYILQPNTDEYNFVNEKFRRSLSAYQIVEIMRIQNRRWYRQYDAHKDDFTERYGKSTEQWLFHGCKSQSTQAIMNDCFNRSHAVRCAVGQGIYFATDANISLSYTQPDANNHRHMFMARVLVGKTTTGNQSTRVCPPGFDTTGGGNVFVTYHDAQAYGEYLITFRQ